MSGALSNTAALCFILGWQGGTVHQVAKELDTDTSDIINANENLMGLLARRAQVVRQNRENSIKDAYNKTTLKY